MSFLRILLYSIVKNLIIYSRKVSTLFIQCYFQSFKSSAKLLSNRKWKILALRPKFTIFFKLETPDLFKIDKDTKEFFLTFIKYKKMLTRHSFQFSFLFPNWLKFYSAVIQKSNVKSIFPLELIKVSFNQDSYLDFEHLILVYVPTRHMTRTQGQTSETTLQMTF